MRILLRARRNERGATAIFVGVIAVALIGIASFTLDFGQAYVGKRQLQTATDAAALAAAASYVGLPGSCDDLRNDSSAETTAKTIADDMLDQNRPGAVAGTLSVDCTADGKGLSVEYTAANTTPITLGAVYGGHSITTDRSSTASMSVPPSADHLRPYAICSQDLPTDTELNADGTSQVIKVDLPGTGHSHPPCTQPSGQWWTIVCPGADGQPGSQSIDDELKNGCDYPVSVVPDQEDHDSTAGDLYDYLLNQSPGCGGGYSWDCLEADPGEDLTGHTQPAIWKNDLLGKSIIIPVFCSDPYCSPDAIGDGPTWGGSNGEYPIYAFAAVRVCGFHFGSSANKKGQVTDGSCAPSNNPNNFDAVSDTDNNSNYLLFSYTKVMASGSIGTSVCALGDKSCDGGLRRVQLIK